MTFANHILTDCGVNADLLCSMIERGIQEESAILPDLMRTQSIAEHALSSAMRLKSSFVGSEHLLLGALWNPDPVLTLALDRLGIQPAELASRGEEYVHKQIEKGKQALLRPKRDS